MWSKLLQLIAPFSSIARELAIIRELYEIELASRSPAIRRITESPSDADTEITYSDDIPLKTRGSLRKMMEGDTSTDEDDDVFS